MSKIESREIDVDLHLEGTQLMSVFQLSSSFTSGWALGSLVMDILIDNGETGNF